MPVSHIYLSKDGKAFGPYTQEQIDGMRASGEILGYAWICTDPAQGWVPVNAPPPPPPPVPAAAAAPAQPQESFQASAGPVALEPMQPEEPVEPVASPRGSPMMSPDSGPPDLGPAMPEQDGFQAPEFPTEDGPGPSPGPVASPQWNEAAYAPPSPSRSSPRVSAEPSEQSVLEGQSLLAICHNAQHMVSGTLVQVTSRGGVLADPSPAELHPMFRGGATVRLNLLDEASGRSENLFARIEVAFKKEGAWEYQVSWESMPQLLRRG